MQGLDFLQKIGIILRQSLSSEETYAAVFNILDEVLEYDSATLFITSSESGELEVADQRGPKVVDLVSGVAFSRGSGLSGWVASRGEPVILSSLSAGKHRDFRSLVSMPLIAAGDLRGVLNLGHSQAGFYSQSEKGAFQQLAVQLTFIVEQLRLRTELEKKNEQLEKLLKKLQDTQLTLVETERLAAIGEVVVKLNHEINNPLAIIISCVDSIQLSGQHIESDLGKKLEKVKESAYRIDKVTKALSNLESAESEEYVEGVRMLKID